MIFGDGVVAVALLVLWVFCILDVISTEEALCRSLPKYLWLFIVIILPDVGSIAWLLLGRPVGAGFRLGSQIGVYKPQKRAIGPEDSPDFLASIESTCASVSVSGGQNRIVEAPHVSNKAPRLKACSMISFASALAGSLLWRSLTNSTPTIRPRPRTSPICS